MDKSKKPKKTREPLTTRRSFVAGTLSGVTAVALVGCGSGGDAGGNAGTAGSGGASGSAGTGGSSGVGNGGTSGVGGTSGASGTAGTGGTSGDGGTCTLYPQQMEGPFYLDDDLVRKDISEGKPGTPLLVTLIVLRASDCAPLAGVAVDLWQCDAGGVYSGYPGQVGGLDTTGQTFLRGTQITDETGRVEFVTIYPGWYPGRTTHLHFKVRPTATTEATSQLYFPEDVTTNVYETPPYDARGQKDTPNTADGVLAGQIPPLLEISKSGLGYAGTLTVAVAL